MGANVTMREVASRVWAHDGLRGFWAGMVGSEILELWTRTHRKLEKSCSLVERTNHLSVERCVSCVFGVNLRHLIPSFALVEEFSSFLVPNDLRLKWTPNMSKGSTSVSPSPWLTTRGLWPNVTRTFLVNAAELGTYDEAKSRLVPILGDGFLAHVPWQTTLQKVGISWNLDISFILFPWLDLARFLQPQIILTLR